MKMINQEPTPYLVMAEDRKTASDKAKATAAHSKGFKFDASKAIQKLVIMAFIIVVAVGASLFIKSNIARVIQVDGASMVPTLAENGKYIANYWEVRTRDPKRNDIVVFKDPGDGGLSVKRVIAVEGESVMIKAGKVFVNGKELDENYLMANTRTFTYCAVKEEFITLGTGQYFLLGDNRSVSIDSRSYGPVSHSAIMGFVDPKRALSL